MFIDVAEFRRKLSILVRHYDKLTEDEREIVDRADRAYFEMEALLERIDERIETKMTERGFFGKTER